MERLPSHFEELLEIIDEQRQVLGEDIAISAVPSVMERSTGSPFVEGDRLSGNVQHGDAEASLTITAAPHFRASIPIDSFRSVARTALDLEPRLPEGLASDAELAPHLVVWWRANQQGQTSTVDLLDLCDLPPKERADFAMSITKQATRALDVLEPYIGVPVVYGTWGFGDPEERRKNGLSRGGPSLPDGHFHVAKIDEVNQHVTLHEDATNTQRLKHYQPWNRLINRHFGEAIAGVLAKVVRNDMLGEHVADVEYYSRVAHHADERSSQQEGYEVSYITPVLLSEAFSRVVDIAGRVDTLYRSMAQLYETWYKSTDRPSVLAEVRDCMDRQGMAFGFDKDTACLLAEFSLRIKPTLGQLRQWCQELECTNNKPVDTNSALLGELDRRERLMGRAKNRESLVSALVLDSNKDPKHEDILHTWPLRSSAAYLFDDIFVLQGQIWVNKFSVLPAIVSTAGAPEKILGVEIARDTGNHL